MEEITRQQVQFRQADGSSAQAAVDWFTRHEVPLQPQEVFIQVWRDSLLVLFNRILVSLLLAIIEVVVFFLTSRRATLIETILSAALLPVSAAVLGWLSVGMLRWYFRIYVLTNRRLIRREGILWHVRNEVPLPKVQNASYTAATFQKWMGLGTVKVETASTGPAFRMDNVRNAQAISQRILRAADEVKYRRELLDEEQVRRILEENLVAPSPRGVS